MLILTSCQGNAPTSTPGIDQTVSTDDKGEQTAAIPPLKLEATVTTPPTQLEVARIEQPAGCTVVSPRPTPGPTEQSIFPPVSDLDWVSGSEEASITLVEYSDFQ